MALIEKTTRKIEIDEANGSHINIRETTHMADDTTGEIIYRDVKHHRKVITTGDDTMAVSEGLTQTASEHWTSEVRQAQDDRETAAAAEIAAQEAAVIAAEAAAPTTTTSPEKGVEPQA